jgi:hypothetical protein
MDKKLSGQRMPHFAGRLETKGKTMDSNTLSTGNTVNAVSADAGPNLDICSALKWKRSCPNWRKPW